MRHDQTIVVGGGTAGCAVAGRLAEAGEHVVLIEAGPDFGPADAGRWPQALLDPSIMPVDHHSWGYTNSGIDGHAPLALQRARVIGGCSSHNGCAVVWGHRADYDAWEAAGNPGWGAAGMIPYLSMANQRLRVSIPDIGELTPFHQLVIASAPGVGLPPIADFSNLDETHGLGPGPVNIAERRRWNTSFAYLDPVREMTNFTLMPDTLVDRLLLDGDRVIGVAARGPSGTQAIRSSRVVLAGGAYGTPLLLQRSGIGDPSDIEAQGIYVQVELPGVGRNLQDHPALSVDYTGTPDLTRMLDDFVSQGGLPREEGTIGLFSSRRCEGPFDMHLYPIAHRNGPGDWNVFIASAVMAPRSTGTIAIAGVDPETPPRIEHRYLSDTQQYDLDALVDGLHMARSLGASEPLASLIGTEIGPFADCRTDEQIRARIPLHSAHDYHPASTCKMGPPTDPLAVVDATGAVYGVGGLHIADASIFPSVTWANTNLPVLAAAEKIAAGLLAS